MGSTFGYYGVGLNTGSYFGNGYTSTGTSSVFGNRVASSTNINRISRDVTNGYSQDMEVINLYLQRGDIDQALALYDSLFNEVKTTANGYGYNLTDGQISSVLNNAYRNATGNTFINSLEEECHSSFVTGLAEGIPIIGWFVNGNSDAEAVAKVSGTKTRLIDKIAEGAGAALSGAAAGAAIGLIGGPAGVVIGAIAGAATGIFKTIVK